MRLVEDSASVLPFCRKVVRDDAVDLEVPTYLENLVEDVIHRLSSLLVRYDIDVVEDADGLFELIDLNRVRVQGVV